jgi:transcriptional regulator with XRE-family HTH domain
MAEGRRRTPGPRQKEVAQLAGVGVTWYTWLQQGRAIRPSGQVLDAISRALRLDCHEREHLALPTLATTQHLSVVHSDALPSSLAS